MTITRAPVILLFVIAFTGYCFAQGAPAAIPTPASPLSPPEKIGPPQNIEKGPQKLKLQYVVGKLVSVDPGGRSLTLRDNEKEMKLAIDSKAVQGELKLARVGDRVSIGYVDDRGELVAKTVQVQEKMNEGM